MSQNNKHILHACSVDAGICLLPGATAVFRFDAEGGATAVVNDAFSEIFGVEREEACAALSADPFCYVDPEDAPAVRAAFSALPGGEAPRLDRMLRCRRGDETRCVHVLTSSVRGDDDEPAVLVSAFDVSKSALDAVRPDEEWEHNLANEEHYRIALESTSLSVWDYDIKTGNIYQSPHSQQIHGFERIIPDVPESLIAAGYIHPDDAEAYRELYRRVAAGTGHTEGVFRVHTSGRDGYWYEHIRYTSLFDPDGKPYLAVGMSDDVTEKYQTQKDYAREMRLQQVLAADVYASMLIDVTDWRVLRSQCRDLQTQTFFQNTDLQDILQAAIDSVVEDAPAKQLFEDLKAHSLDALYAHNRNMMALEYLRVMPDRIVRWVREDMHLMTDPDNGHLMLFLWIKDIDSDKRRLDELYMAAETDSMTGLLDHEATIRHIKRFLQTDDGADMHALYMIDIDNFKLVNDRLGHQKGDEVIARVASAICSLFRGSDIRGRIGGDEFLVLMKKCGSAGAAMRKAAELVDALQFVCSGDGISVELSASIGVNLYTGDGQSFDALYAGADAALYSVKKAGKNRYEMYAGASEIAEAAAATQADSSGMLQLRTLLEQMDGGVLVAEVSDRIRVTYASPSFYRTMQRSAEEAGSHGELVLSLVNAEDRPALFETIHRIAETGEVLDGTYRVTLNDGGTGWRHLRAARLPDDGGVRKVIGVVTDITELKRAGMLREAIVDNAPCGIGLLEWDGEHLNPIFFNRTMLNMTGFSTMEKAAARIGGDALSAISEADRASARSIIDDVVANGKPCEMTYRSLNAHAMLCARGLKIYEDNGKPVLLLMYTDVTREHEMERELRFAEERYRVAMAQSNIIIWEVDIRTHVFRQSPEMAKRFGHSQTEFANVPDSLIASSGVHPDSARELRRMYDNMYAGKDDETYFSRGYVDGEYVWLKVRFKVLHDADGKPYYAIGISEPVSNIDTQMRRFEREQRICELLANTLIGSIRVNLSQNLIEQIDMHGDPRYTPVPRTYDALLALTKRTFSDGHERTSFCKAMSVQNQFTQFRNNCNSVLTGYKRCMPDGSERYSNCLSHLFRHPISGDLYAFINVLDVDNRYRLEQRLNEPAQRDPTSLLYTGATGEAMVRALLSMERPKDELCAMTLVEFAGLDAIRSSKGAAVTADLMFTIGRLFRVLPGPDGIVSMLDDSHLMLFHTSVRSDDAHLTRIMQLRERVCEALEKAHPDEKPELVLGYATEPCGKAVYEAMLYSARLACRTAAHWADHPVARYAEPKDAEGEQTVPVLQPQDDREHTVLIVDDASEARRLLSGIFAQSYRILEAENGIEALKFMREDPNISAVVLDLIMPEMDGFEVLERMHHETAISNIPVIVVTAENSADNEMRALDLGAADVISKPFRAQTMLLRVRNLIERSNSARIAEQNRAYELRFQQQANLLRLANYDPVTGIFNKRAFCQLLREQLDENPDTRFALVRWDIDRFKVFNDTFGTQAGDKLLHSIGSFLHASMVRTWAYAHLEADHFVIAMPCAQLNLETLMQQIETHLSAQPLAFGFTPRIGMYMIDEPEIDVSLMCDRALLALRSVKKSYSNRIGYYDRSLRNRLLEEQSLIGGIQEAIAREEFELYFQPQYNYASGELIGAEALVRWNHPTRGLLQPSAFIPLFESNGCISELDQYVWERSCRAMRRWTDRMNSTVPVSVAINISRLDIYSSSLCDTLKTMVDRYDLPPSSLKLEITESAYIENPEQLIDAVERLRNIGFTVEMDDFGSGYSSLNTLKDVPVDVLKLDMRFLARGGDDSRGGRILRSVIRMAQSLQLSVIAEGVESKAQADNLLSLGCMYMQGFYFARPMKAKDFEALLAKETLGTMGEPKQTDF